MILLSVMVIVLLAGLVFLGLCFGSFINAFIWRFHDGKLGSIVRGRSRCGECGHELTVRDLIPVVSFIWLRGRCRYCHKPIQDKPWSELAVPLLFVVSYLAWPQPFHGVGLVAFCFWLLFLTGFVALSLYDLKWFELPHDIVFPLVCLALLQIIIMATIFHQGWHIILDACGGVVALGGIFVFLYRISPKLHETKTAVPEQGSGTSVGTAGPGTTVFGMLLGWLAGNRMSTWIGGGDITLGILLGLLVGGPGNSLLLLFLASLIGTLAAIPLLVTGRAGRGSLLPFGPFLIAAAIIVKLWGANLIAWYGNLLIG